MASVRVVLNAVLDECAGADSNVPRIQEMCVVAPTECRGSWARCLFQACVQMESSVLSHSEQCTRPQGPRGGSGARSQRIPGCERGVRLPARRQVLAVAHRRGPRRRRSGPSTGEPCGLAFALAIAWTCARLRSRGFAVDVLHALRAPQTRAPTRKGQRSVCREPLYPEGCLENVREPWRALCRLTPSLSSSSVSVTQSVWLRRTTMLASPTAGT